MIEGTGATGPSNSEEIPMPSNSQAASPCILLITNGSKQAGHCIDNAFHMAKTTGLRLVITQCTQAAETAESLPEQNAARSNIARLVQAARQEGIKEVVAYEQDCWGEDEFDDLIRVENSQCTILAV